MKTGATFDLAKAASVDLKQAAAYAADSIVSRTLLRTAAVQVTLFAFNEGQELTPHTNQRRALVQILEGECDFFFGGTWQRLQAGALIHLPPNDPHAVKAAGPFKMLLTLCTEPSPAALPS